MIDLEKGHKPQILLDARIGERISLALQQNGFPIIRSISIHNFTRLALDDATLEISASPGFMAPVSIPLACLPAGELIHVEPVDVNLDYGYLEGLEEAKNARLTARVRQQSRTLAEKHFPLELLARNQWGGLANYPESVAAFVLPNDPAIDRLLGHASVILQKSTANAAFTNYRRGRASVWRQLAAIWQAVANRQIAYMVPPASFEETGQKIRSPGHILESRVATCLDTSLLLAACIEQVGLSPLVIFTRGHACVGCWLVPEKFASLVTDDVTAIRKRIALKEMLVFESTLLHPPAATFEAACAAVSLKDDEFLCAVDILRTREQKITPLTLYSPPASDQTPKEIEPDSGIAAEPPADLLVEDHLDEVDSGAANAGRLELWQRKLLDLSLRNNLLNFKGRTRSVSLVVENAPLLEDMLADGDRFKVESGLKRIASRMLVDGEGESEEALLQAQGRLLLPTRVLLAPLDERELEKRLVKLHRAARSAQEEGGANILYLAIGFLAWRPKGSSTICRAPLVLLPIRLERKNAKSGFVISAGEDESRFNLTLLELLRKDFGISSLDGFETALPEDAHGLDIPKIWQTVRRAIRDMEGWELEESVVISTFSFAKYLMWQDLRANTDLLRENDLVRHLLKNPELPYQSDMDFVKPEELDVSFKPTDIHCPLLADSSQLAAVASAARGKDFVLVGPPGTGKSQTIANMIAQCLAENKTVLFVAEKTAALNVVHDRLKKTGLGDFCLELHSNKANKAAVVRQLGLALERASTPSQLEWERLGSRLQQARDRLNAHAAELHRHWPNGLTPHAAMGIIIRDNNLPDVPLHWPNANFHDAAAHDQLFQKAAELKIHAQKCLPLLTTALRHAANEQWSPLQQKKFDTIVPACRKALADVARRWQEFAGGEAAPELATLTALYALLQALPADFSFPQWMRSPELSRLVGELEDALHALESMANLERQLSDRVRPGYEAIFKLIRNMPKVIEKYGQFGRGLMASLDFCSWSPAWEEELAEEIRNALEAGSRLEKTAVALATLLEIEPIALNGDFLSHWEQIAKMLPMAHGHQWAFAASPHADTALGQLRKAQPLLQEMRVRLDSLQGTHAEEVFSLDLKALQKAWAESGEAWFWKRGKVRKQVLAALGCTEVECEKDLPMLVEIAALREKLPSQGDLSAATCGLWQGADTDADELASALQFADALKDSLAAMPISTRQFNELCARVENLLQRGMAQLGPGGSGRKILVAFASAASAYSTAMGRLKELVKHDFGAMQPEESRKELTELLTARSSWRSAAQWQKFVERCHKVGLEPGECGQGLVPGMGEGRLTDGRTGKYLAFYATDGDLQILQQIQTALEALAKFAWLEKATENLWQGPFTSVEEVSAMLEIARGVAPLGASLGDSRKLAELLAATSEKREQANILKEGWAKFQEAQGELVELLATDSIFASGTTAAIMQDLADLLSLGEHMGEWSAFLRKRAEAASLGMGPLVNALIDGMVAPEELERTLAVNYSRWWIMAVIDELNTLKTFELSSHEHERTNFEKNDEQMRLGSATHIAGLLVPGQDLKEEFPGEAFILSRELLKKKRHLPLRQLLGEIPNLARRIAPCMLMSPLSVAQYLEPGRHKFDVVIFDEASQVPIWDAIGAMARGRRIVVAGDPQQLPPTNFFQRGEEEDFDGATDIDAGMESILDECRNVGVANLSLRWHYRSRFENLISFSNRKYYDSRLVTFPGAETGDASVSVRYVDGIYERGGSRTNPLEAEKLVEAVIDHLTRDGSRSIGIVTFNMQQQQLIEDLLEDARRKYPALEQYFAADAPEPLFVKNLENVQGDERDFIYFSICFAPDKNGQMTMNFGALSREGGERRLNVAITRARDGLRIFSSIRPEQISLNQTRSAGARDLREFLEFAEKGGALPESGASRRTQGADAFVEGVAEGLASLGWQTRAHIGRSSFGVDLGVIDPDQPDRFLAGVECDGAAYASAVTARDRERLHEMVLGNLGWHVLRIWSTDWWLRKNTALHNLHEELSKLLQEARNRREREATAPVVAPEEKPQQVASEPDTIEEAPQIFASLAANAQGCTEFRAAPVATETPPAPLPEPDSEEERMQELICKYVANCSPVHLNDLARQVATGLGYKRYGKRIQTEVRRLAEAMFFSTIESSGLLEEAVYFWAEGQTPENFKLPRKIRAGRKVEEISMVELLAIARSIPVRKADPIGCLAAKLGIKRLHESTRTRLQTVWTTRLNEQPADASED